MRTEIDPYTGHSLRLSLEPEASFVMTAHPCKDGIKLQYNLNGAPTGEWRHRIRRRQPHQVEMSLPT